MNGWVRPEFDDMITIVCDRRAHDGKRDGEKVFRLKRNPHGGWGLYNDGSDMDDTFLLRGERATRHFLDGDHHIHQTASRCHGDDRRVVPEAATRMTYELRCKCGNYVPARAEHLHPILDTLLAAGKKTITLEQLRSRLANRARGGPR